MASIPCHVAESFLDGKKDKAGNFHTDGTAIYSYGLLLATRDNKPPYNIRIEHPLDGSNNRSLTTQRHIRALASTLAKYFANHPETRESYLDFVKILTPGTIIWRKHERHLLQ